MTIGSTQNSKQRQQKAAPSQEDQRVGTKIHKLLSKRKKPETDKPKKGKLSIFVDYRN